MDYGSSFGSYSNKKFSIKRKGAGASKSQKSYYAQLEREAEIAEAK